jgi:hypothetical protein
MLGAPPGSVVAVLTSGGTRSHRARITRIARFALFVEAGHDADLREPLARGRATVEAPLVLALAGLGVRDPRAATAVLVPCLQGLLLRHISRLDDADPRPVVSRVVQAVLG